MLKTEFVAIGGNRRPDAADYNAESGTVAFGAERTVAIWKPGSTIEKTLKGHAKPVTTVKYAGQLLLTGSEDGTVRLWKDSECVANVEAHARSVTCLAKGPDSSDVFLSGSTDGSVAVWKMDVSESQVAVTEVARVRVNERFYPLCLAAHMLEDGAVLVAIGGTANKVHLAVVQGSDFPIQASLEGHEGWVRSLAFRSSLGDDGDGDVLLASASQDRYIRLWRLHRGDVASIGSRTEEATLQAGLANKAYYLQAGKYNVTYEALLMGHDDWIFNVRWHPTKLVLLSASADSTLMLWAPDATSGVWICADRLGDVAIKGASTATGASGGFWTGLWLDGGSAVAAVGKTGSWRIWRKTEDGVWTLGLGVSGHTREATSVSWADDGSYLLTTSLDQTTRLWSPWTASNGDGRWYETSRPQIHGYDMIAVSSVSPTVFVSGGDEKTLRVFEQPRAIAELLHRVSGTASIADTSALPEGASVPALGLSNKQQDAAAAQNEDEVEAADEQDGHAQGQLASHVLADLVHPPTEDQLQRHTLWPETEKLYGHGYEIVAVDVSHDKKLVATTCRANNESAAVVRLYSTSSYLEIKPPLAAHSLTVTRVRFSPDDRYLLSVSRDRGFAVWRRTGPETMELAAHNPKAHARIIWDCCWLADGSGFITASRDKSLKLWRAASADGSAWTEQAQLKIDAAITAIDVNDASEVVVGTETGSIYVYGVIEDQFVLGASMPKHESPETRISAVQWRAAHRGQFAVASEDTSVRLYRVAQ